MYYHRSAATEGMCPETLHRTCYQLSSDDGGGYVMTTAAMQLITRAVCLQAASCEHPGVDLHGR